jgi:hypothetical protein
MFSESFMDSMSIVNYGTNLYKTTSTTKLKENYLINLTMIKTLRTNTMSHLVSMFSESTTLNHEAIR